MDKAIQSILKGEKLITEPMEKDCRLVFIIPVYNEGADTILKCLESLAAQNRSLTNRFEVLIIVNNSKAQARKKTKEFLQNQKIIRLINYLKGLSGEGFKLTAARKKSAYIIRQSGLRIRLIDKTSASYAYTENSVGLCYNRAAAEAARRFKSCKIGGEGILCLSVANCAFSRNFVSCVINNYRSESINACAGLLQYSLVEKYDYPEIIKKAIEVTVRRPFTVPNKNKIIVQKTQGPDRPVLALGTDLNPLVGLTLKTKIFFQAGGMPLLFYGAFKELIKQIMLFYGEVALDFNCSVFYGIRRPAPARTMDFRVIAGEVARAIKDFDAGKSKSITVRNFLDMNYFFGELLAFPKRPITLEEIAGMFRRHGFEPKKIAEKDLKILAGAINKEVRKPLLQRSYKEFKKLFLKKYYRLYPKTDITKRLADIL